MPPSCYNESHGRRVQAVQEGFAFTSIEESCSELVFLDHIYVSPERKTRAIGWIRVDLTTPDMTRRFKWLEDFFRLPRLRTTSL